jgi:hypothetical protein
LDGNPLASDRVYRHLEQKWVREFFDSGRLRLTTLAYCREHDIPTRWDSRDGRINFSVRDDWQMMAGVCTAGLRSYMLCGSRSYARAIRSRLSTDSWIEIVDVAGFAAAVANAIDCTGEYRVEACRYVDIKEVNTLAAPITDCIAPLFEATRDLTADLEAEFEKANALIAQAIGWGVGDNAYFMKDRGYEVEEEVRFVWPVDRAVDGPRVFLCEGALRFCRPGP